MLPAAVGSSAADLPCAFLRSKQQSTDVLDLLRLSAFFCNAALTAQLCSHLAGQLSGMEEEAVLEVGAGCMVAEDVQGAGRRLWPCP